MHIAGMTPHPNETWMTQMARNSTMVEWGFLTPGQYLIHDRDAKFCSAFQESLKAAGVTLIKLPSTQSEFECLRRELGEICELGSLVAAPPVWGRGSTESAERVWHPLSSGTPLIREKAMNYLLPRRGKRVGAPIPFTLAKDWVDC